MLQSVRTCMSNTNCHTGCSLICGVPFGENVSQHRCLRTLMAVRLPDLGNVSHKLTLADPGTDHSDLRQWSDASCRAPVTLAR